MTYPLLRVHLNRIKENGQRIIKKCNENGIDAWAVSKGISAFNEIARTYKEAGFRTICDSRLLNIHSMQKGVEKLQYALIRVPMRSELVEAISTCEYSLVSDIGTIIKMSELCDTLHIEHKIIIMFDMGDLREGFLYSDIDEIAECITELSSKLQVVGVGANFSCASGVLPMPENIQNLVNARDTLKEKTGLELSLISGGGSCSYVQLCKGELNKAVNSLRIGEALLLGRDMAFAVDIDGLHQNTMEIEAELAEIRVKPTMPKGKIGHDAFGNIPVFKDRGDRKKGILCIGKQDVRIEGLTPLQEGVKIITSSSDHMIVDLEDCPKEYKVGDILTFLPNYTAMLAASTSPYVTKIFEEN
ncbi:MAG: alanine racemase [Synergistaceae bacterium]